MLLDTRVLADMSSHTGPAVAADLVAFFIAESRNLVDAAVRCAEARDYDAVRRSAHSIKSSAGQFGAFDLQEAADALERAAQGSSERVDPLVAEMRRVSAATLTALERWLEAAAPG